MKKFINRYLEKDFVRFCIVGAVGFVVNLTFLYLLVGRLGLNIVVAQLISAEMALLSNFYWHNIWTYNHLNHKHISVWSKLTKFHVSSWSGLALNVFIVSLSYQKLNYNYTVSLAIASILVLLWNFIWTRYTIFGNRTEESSEPPVL